MSTETAHEIASLHHEIAALRAQLAERDRQLEADGPRSKSLAPNARSAFSRLSQSSNGGVPGAHAPSEEDTRILARVLECMGDAVAVIDRSGRPVLINTATQRIFGSADVDQPRSVWATSQRFFYPDGVTPLPAEESPTARALRGEACEHIEFVVQNAVNPDGVHVSSSATPIRDDEGAIVGVVSVLRDVTEQRRLEADLRRRNEELEKSERERAELVDRLRAAMDETSTPILEVWDDVLALPVIGIVDSSRSAQMMERLLEAVVKRRARNVVIDVTGVEVIDTATAGHFVRLVRAVGLLGARCVLAGIRPAVAQTLVGIGLELDAVQTYGTLKHALQSCLAVQAPRRR